MKVINGKHLYDAYSMLSAMGKKAANYVILALKQVERHANMKDYESDRLYVQSAIINK